MNYVLLFINFDYPLEKHISTLLTQPSYPTYKTEDV